MSKKNKKEKNTDAAVVQQPFEMETPKVAEVKEGFFRKHWNGAKKKVSENKKLIIGAVGGAVAATAAAAGLYFLGSDSEIELTDLDETEGGEEDESPQDE